jgi:glycosyltransferase involved in cell wall biosynthesis
VAIVDAALALVAGLASLPVVAWALLSPRRAAGHDGRHLLVLDCSYSLAVMRARQMEHVVLSRDLDGWFDHVWTVHPLVGASPDDPPETGEGPVAVSQLAGRHTMVEGKVARFAALKALPLTNFVLAQAALLAHLSRLVRRTRFSAVTIADPYYLGVLGRVLARFARAPLVLAVNANHDSLYELTGSLAYPRLLRRRSVERRIARRVMPRLDMVLVGSEDNAEFAIANGADPRRVARIERGASIHPLHLADLGERANVADEVGGRPYAICVSRLEPAKHVEDVLEVMAEVRRTDPSLRLVLVGDGSLRPRLEAQARELGVADQVLFAGTREQPWLAGALRDAEIVLAPIAGRALLEAALSGTPIVAYDYEWQGELIRHGETGLLVPYRDHAAMAAAVLALRADPERAQAIGGRARAEVGELKDPRQVAAELRGKYVWLLDSQTP